MLVASGNSLIQCFICKSVRHAAVFNLLFSNTSDFGRGRRHNGRRISTLVTDDGRLSSLLSSLETGWHILGATERATRLQDDMRHYFAYASE